MTAAITAAEERSPDRRPHLHARPTTAQHSRDQLDDLPGTSGGPSGTHCRCQMVGDPRACGCPDVSEIRGALLDRTLLGVGGEPVRRDEPRKLAQRRPVRRRHAFYSQHGDQGARAHGDCRQSQGAASVRRAGHRRGGRRPGRQRGEESTARTGLIAGRIRRGRCPRGVDVQPAHR
jgi:hypothetical protein